MGDAPLAQAHTYELKHTTQRVQAEVARVVAKLDIDNMEQRATDGMAANDIVRVTIETRRPISCGPNGETGSFILIDPAERGRRWLQGPSTRSFRTVRAVRG